MKTLTKEQKEWFKEISGKHRKAVLGDTFTTTNDSPPVCYMKMKDGYTHAYFIKTEGKPIDALKNLVNKMTPEAYIFVAESWVLVKKAGKKIPTWEEVQNKYPNGISTHPDREEHLIMVSSTMTGYTHLDNFKIIRDKTNRIKKLKPLDKMNNENHKQKLESDKIP